MNDKQLRAVVESARCGSFAKAAELLYISAPALKKQIDTLEAELGVRLFERSNRGLKLTEIGKGFLQFSKKTVAAMEKEIKRIEETKKKVNTIYIGYNHYQTFDYIYYEALTAFYKEHGNIEIELNDVRNFSVENCDLILGIKPQDGRAYCRHMLYQLPLTCLIRADHPLSQRSRMTLHDLAGYRLFMPSDITLSCMTPALRAADFQHIRQNSESMGRDEYVMQCLTNGCISVIIGCIENNSVSIRQIPFEGYSFDYSFYQPEDHCDKPYVREYVEFLQQYYAQEGNKRYWDCLGRKTDP